MKDFFYCECGYCEEIIIPTEKDLEVFGEYRFNPDGSAADSRDMIAKSCPNMHHYDQNKLLAVGDNIVIFDQYITTLQHIQLGDTIVDK